MSLPDRPILSSHAWKFLERSDQYIERSLETGSSRQLLAPSTERQFRTASKILDMLVRPAGPHPAKGVLLADDVGMGKTTIAALVAWVFAGKERSVVVVAPNKVVRRRWETELDAHLAVLCKMASHLNLRMPKENAKRSGLELNGIKVITTTTLKNRRTLAPCGLLVIDEAHRARGARAEVANAVRKAARKAERVLILTATPFSIDIKGFQRLLLMIGADPKIYHKVEKSKKLLDDFYKTPPDQFSAEELEKQTAEAIEALQQVVIRNSANSVSAAEMKDLGGVASDAWKIVVPPANDDIIEILVRADRLLRLDRDFSQTSSQRTNDPRFHVGWKQLDTKVNEIDSAINALPPSQRTARTELVDAMQLHINALRELRSAVGAHPKIEAVVNAVAKKVRDGEKVVVFCHHIAVAQEVGLALDEILSSQCAHVVSTTKRDQWRAAWRKTILKVLAGHYQLDDTHLDEISSNRIFETFIAWLSTDRVIWQVKQWREPAIAVTIEPESLLSSRRRASPRRDHKVSIAAAAAEMFLQIHESESLSALFHAADTEEGLSLIPGADPRAAVLVMTKDDADEDVDNGDDDENDRLFWKHRSADAALAVFNSPFGPDVLVVTDAMSESIDLHRYCRYLVHYELDASPIRTLQRNGRLRRIGSWAARTGKEIMIAYPFLEHTRDERLVKIMQQRIEAFGLLLGGVPSVDIDTASEQAERDRLALLHSIRTKLTKHAKALQ